MQRKKSLVLTIASCAYEETGKAYTYIPGVKHSDAAKSALKHVIERFFGDSPNALAVALLDDVALRESDREQIRHLLERKKGKARS